MRKRNAELIEELAKSQQECERLRSTCAMLESTLVNITEITNKTIAVVKKQATYKLVLLPVPALGSKIPIIKAIRQISGLGLRDAVDFVNFANSLGSNTILSRASLDAVDAAKDLIEAAGGVCQVNRHED